MCIEKLSVVFRGFYGGSEWENKKYEMDYMKRKLMRSEKTDHMRFLKNSRHRSAKSVRVRAVH